MSLFFFLIVWMANLCLNSNMLKVDLNRRNYLFQFLEFEKFKTNSVFF